MNVKIEIAKNRSPHFAFVARILRQHPTYNIIGDAGVEIHSVELTEHEFPLFSHLEYLTSSWKTVNFILDGEYDSRYRVLELLYREFEKISPAEAAIEKSKRDFRRKRDEKTEQFSTTSF